MAHRISAHLSDSKSASLGYNSRGARVEHAVIHFTVEAWQSCYSQVHPNSKREAKAEHAQKAHRTQLVTFG